MITNRYYRKMIFELISLLDWIADRLLDHLFPDFGSPPKEEK